MSKKPTKPQPGAPLEEAALGTGMISINGRIER